MEWHRHLVNEPNHDRVFKNHRNEAELELDEDEIRYIGTYRLRARAGRYSVLIGESNVAIDPAIGGYGVADIYLGEFSPHRSTSKYRGT